ncbi:hypothetical protein R9X47_00255 [Wukongibacter baidiensis]|uniref:hypothetical protein n=1 Tax=Wukongibacter baidiensis TaxID=1723361 RepID=UPI003D7FC906
MIIALTVFLIVLGSFFVCLGMLFINYNLSPMKKIVDKQYVYKNNKLGFQVMIPGLVLMVLSCIIFINNR